MAQTPLVKTTNYFSALNLQEEEDNNIVKSNDNNELKTKSSSITTRGGKNNNNNRGTTTNTTRGRKYFKEGNNSSSSNLTSNKLDGKENLVSNENDSNDEKVITSDNRGRGRGRGTRGTRGGRGRGRGSRGSFGNEDSTVRGGGNHRRVFDRHSQTAHQDTNKTEEKGWGALDGESELMDENQAQSDSFKELIDETPSTNVVDDDGNPKVEELTTNIDDWGFEDTTTTAEQQKEEGRGNVEKKDPSNPSNRRKVQLQDEEKEDNTQTYTEYLAKQELENEKKLRTHLELRAPNEGIDETKLWEGTKKLARKGEYEEEVFFIGKKHEPKIRKQKEGKIYLETPGLTHPTPSFRGGRGRGRGSSRFDSNQPPSILGRETFSDEANLDDKSSFPSLH